LLISSFNGKPQALPLDFAYAFGSPLNENNQCTPNQHPAGLYRLYRSIEAVFDIPDDDSARGTAMRIGRLGRMN
jgi:hypothetical protein